MLDPSDAGAATPAGYASEATPNRGQTHLVLMGAGHAHIEILRRLAKHPIADVRVTLISPHARLPYFAKVTDFVGGHCAPEDCSAAIEPLVRKAGVHWLRHSAKGLDADKHSILLDDGSVLTYDLLSINTGAVQNRARIEAILPGARNHGLFVRPMENFLALWPKVVELAQHKPLRIAVVGGGVAGIELALVMRHRLPACAVTLVAGTGPFAPNCPELLRTPLELKLQSQGVTILRDDAASLDGQTLLLRSGAALACDVPVLAVGAHAPPWLMQCGLTLDAQGFVSVNPHLQSVSHPEVFAAGDISTVLDSAVPRSGYYSAQAGKVLDHNLRATLAKRPMRKFAPRQKPLFLLNTGGRQAMGSWGPLLLNGRLAWWIKRWIASRWLASYK